MKRTTLRTFLVAGLALGLGGAFTSTGCVAPPQKEAKDKKEVAASGWLTHEDVDDSMNDLAKGDRYRLSYAESDLWKGAPEGAKVTIVEFSDIQCPYCKRLTDTLDKVAKEYPEDVRVVFKHYPLPMHKAADPASRAVIAALKQGKGWEMHDITFANAKKLSDEELDGYAKKIGVPDIEQWKKDMNSDEVKQIVKDDTAFGKTFAVRSTPSFFVNGIPMRGAVGEDKLKAMIEDEIKIADQMLEKGSSRGEIYARFMKAAKTKRDAPPPKERTRRGRPDPAKNYGVPTGDRPSYGPDDALVTIIEYSDFQCPYCTRVLPTIDEVKKKYPKDVRIVFRNQPLPMHKAAPAAARAGLAAHKQGKFWEMHDIMFANAKALNDDKLAELAGEIGLDVDKFKKDFNSDELKKAVAEDQAVARQFGAGGTPAFFINGRFLSGARPFDQFDALIKEELAKAEKFVKDKGVKKEDAYDEMIKGFEKKVDVPPPQPTADHKRRDVVTKGLPSKGNTKNPKITIVECSDFDCPFCKRAAGTVDQVMKEYGDKAAFYFRNYPLPMHKKAEPAHRAAVAAGNQGKFFEMHDKLFADKTKREEKDFIGFAEELGIDVDKFTKDFNDPATAKTVKDDMVACQQAGVRGAPGFLINGRLMSGAQPYPKFKAVLEEELNGGFEATAKKDAAKKAGGAKKAK
jgi:protein-disulfide isomerase